ncbi:hypothetical protein [Photobacterium angustum]|uniref:hypothetical protein n=1 Tax=Photobacterium angustum TaxID=661 RepID=UPI0005E94048|nr:hypothetical protein [Photobacterium angustum]KJG00093.1 hypothetical protein UB35_19770 [Photobacterium angustum]PSV61693.1 hypothetical protein CTM95_20540 [Photobacterium angustum]
MITPFLTKEKCLAEAKRHKSPSAFRAGASAAYQVADLNGWLGECFADMPDKKMPAGYWNKKRCRAVAQVCRSKSELKEKYAGAYAAINRYGWDLDIFPNLQG